MYCVDTSGPIGINDYTHLHHIDPALNTGAHPCCQMHQPMELLLFCSKNIYTQDHVYAILCHVQP